MLKNEYLVAKIGVDPAENELSKDPTPRGGAACLASRRPRGRGRRGPRGAGGRGGGARRPGGAARHVGRGALGR